MALSGIFSPLLVPTYAMAMALWITNLAFLTERVRFIVSLVIFLITAAIPMATIIFMMRMGYVSDTSISDRKQRGVPYIVTGLCYVGAAVYLYVIHAPHWLAWFFIGAFASSAIALVINLWWKISAHGMVMGGLCAMLFFIAINHMAIVWMLPWITGGLIFSGAVGSSRLLLKRHTPWQVYCGWLMGFVVEYAFMSI